jgi:diguanylate cyclase (GGDEF)-like protein
MKKANRQIQRSSLKPKMMVKTNKKRGCVPPNALQSGGFIRQLISQNTSLNQQNTVAGVLAVAGEIALKLTRAHRGIIFVYETGGPVKCAWSKGLSDPFIQQIGKQMLAHALDPQKRVHLAQFIPDIKHAKIITPASQAAFLQEGILSLGVWPLLYEGNNIVSISCFFSSPHRWRKEEQGTMLSFLRQASVALENAQFFESMQDRIQGIVSLNRALTPLFNSRAGTDDLGRQIVETINKEFSSAYCSIFLYDETSNTLRFVAEAGYIQDLIKCMPLDGLGLIVAAYKHGEIIYSPDVNQDARYISGSPLTRCELALPLRTAGRILGVLNMESQSLDAFDENARQALISFSKRATLAIENAQLFELMRQHANQMKFLNEITKTALQATIPEELLQSLADWIGELLGAEGSYIVFRNENQVLIQSSGYLGPDDDKNITKTMSLQGNRMTLEVISSGQTIIVEDVTQSERIDPASLEGSTVHSLMGIPLNANQQTLGMVMVAYYKTHHFTQEELSIGEQAAGQVALALLKNQSLALASQRAQEAENLRTATAALTSSLNISQVLLDILRCLGQVVPHNSACIFLRHGDRFSADAGNGISEADGILGTSFPEDNPFFKEITATGQPLVLFDAQMDYRLNILGKTSRTRGWMGIPLIAGGEIIGMLTLESVKTGSFKQEHAGLAQAFANQAAAALQNASLYEDVQRRAHELAALHTATAALESTLDSQVLLRRILTAAASAVPAAEKGRLVMFNPENGALQVQASIGYPDQDQPDGSFPEQANFLINTIRLGHAVMSSTLDIASGSAIVAPLLIDPQVFGAISLESSANNAFKTTNLDLLISFASTATAAIRSAQLYAEVQKLAITDPLTELYNRRGFFELGMREYERSTRYGHPLACIMIDADLLKKINDTCGHGMGDQVLLSIAKECRYSLRKTDIIGRYGGDEFAILLPETDFPAAKEIATRLRDSISRKQIPCRDTYIPTSISLGVSIIDQNCESLDALLGRADQALYQAKQAGRNCLAIWEPGAG